MSWPIKLRAMSFVVTMGVTITESVMGSIPVAFALWYFDIASGRTVLEAVIVVVAVSFAFDIDLFARASGTFSAARARGRRHEIKYSSMDRSCSLDSCRDRYRQWNRDVLLPLGVVLQAGAGSA